MKVKLVFEYTYVLYSYFYSCVSDFELESLQRDGRIIDKAINSAH